jgi:hypothetical protein
MVLNMKKFKLWLESQRATRFANSLKQEKDQISKSEEEDNWLFHKRYHKKINQYDNVDKIYQNYSNSMNRRRKNSELEYERFFDYIMRDDIYNFRIGKSVIFGSYKDGIFFPSHFCPNSLKEGVKIFKELQKNDVVLAITQDLTDMAESLGFIKVLNNIPFYFRGSYHYKDILVSNFRIIPKLKNMFNDYLQ